MKRHLTRQEEFDIMKLILDKFLWMGVFIMAYGFYRLVNLTDLWYSLTIMFGGALLLLIFTVILIREYHFMK